ncbi:MAG TPA: ribosome small subunit-dependent GTPase A [Candidatus Saccharimonadia bacterium]|nr:ribosome small subunit-dependent GTPase A [Candidatus Saccharimonadia bacterium]
MSPNSDREREYEALRRIGWRDSDAPGVPAELATAHRIARVIAQHRSGYRVHDGVDEFPVQAPATMIRAGTDPREKAAVGDWVVLAPGTPPLIESILPRRTLLTRAAAGERYETQPIAANVDHVLIVCGLDHDYNPRRIERYLLLVQGSGALPVVLLTKRDLVEDPEKYRLEIEAIAGVGAVVHVVNSKDPATAALLAPYLRLGDTSVLVGSSGAGKSTLTNTLLGIEKQKTGGVRGHDSRGRHTTTHRALIMLPQGGCMIDTPGMRELKLTGEERFDATQFADIEALGDACRFSDCSHGNEPGCRILAALASGEIEADRYAHYLKLRDEIHVARGAADALKRKADARVQDKALGKRLVEKYGHR